MRFQYSVQLDEFHHSFPKIALTAMKCNVCYMRRYFSHVRHIKVKYIYCLIFFVILRHVVDDTQRVKILKILLSGHVSNHAFFFPETISHFQFVSFSVLLPSCQYILILIGNECVRLFFYWLLILIFKVWYFLFKNSTTF